MAEHMDRHRAAEDRIEAVIFDMDGLMFDTERLYADCWIQAGREFGVEIGEEYLSKVRGSSAKEAGEIFRRFFGEQPDFWEVRKRWTVLAKQAVGERGVPVKPGLEKLLSYLKKHGYRIALGTSTESGRALMYLEQAGVKGYFDAFACGEMVEKGKPDPGIFLLAARLLGCAPERCAVLEDSFTGIRAATAGGFIPVMIPDITQPDGEIEKMLAGRYESLDAAIEFFAAREGRIQDGI